MSIALSAVAIGVGYGPITPASSHVLAKTTPRERMALMFSIKQTGVPAGTALAGLIVPPLTIAFGWQVAVVLIRHLRCASSLPWHRNRCGRRWMMTAIARRDCRRSR